MNNIFNKGINVARQHKTILDNLSWVTAVEVFTLLAPLITYPYLVKVLGMDLYGYIITAQVLASYVTLIIDFGSNSVVAKHVSINRDNDKMLSEIVCSVFTVRSFLWIICLPIYCGIVALVPSYREFWLLFLLTYGTTLNDVLFPRYFFQGIEKMKISSVINIGIRLFFIALVFILVHNQDDLLMVPVLYTIGYTLAGIASMYIIFGKMRIRFAIPPVKRMMIYVKDSSEIFATDLVCTIKDKLNYFFLGGYSNMANVVVYDLGSKLNGIVVKPTQIISQVFFPRFAKSRDIKKMNMMVWVVMGITLCVVILLNIFMPWVVEFFLHKEIDLMPLRVFSLAPVFLSASSFIGQNYLIAFGHNKYMLYSILVTTAGYLLALGFVAFTHRMSSVYSFVSISLFSYFVEFLYRIATKEKLMRKEK